mgnify:CR=1 FL=1
MSIPFTLGRTVITSNALDKLHPEDAALCLSRHSRGDWGELCEHDRKENERGLAVGGRLFSVYRDRHGVRFYVVTEADRSVTTTLLPEDY